MACLLRRLLCSYLPSPGVQLDFVVPINVLRPLSNADNEETPCSEKSASENSFVLRHRSDHHVSVSFLDQRKPFPSAYSTPPGHGGVVGWPAICTESYILNGTHRFGHVREFESGYALLRIYIPSCRPSQFPFQQFTGLPNHLQTHSHLD